MISRFCFRLTPRLSSQSTMATLTQLAPSMPTMSVRLQHSSSSHAYEDALYDQEQVKFMEQDMCITVNPQDEITGLGTKKQCHLNENIDKGLLHRAFSVFLFNQEGKLLLQQRAKEKITWPECWTNTVCSHPLSNEADERNGVPGVKIAAQRKLGHELNVPAHQVPLDKFHFLTRILYKARSDERWGEHEVDYILFIQVNDVTVKPNPNEVLDYQFVSIDEAKALVKKAGEGTVNITPWFQLIFNRFLFPWWNTLLNNGLLPTDNEIHHLS
eukprot:TRINITY_DN1894_c0_g1_i1.p1 TRINITY_DN1894_c0_g1~~TRINITY_DN1894_c0_g1_i1.p1  ORF type:complete len:271 (-),score=34.65 TRINITY_DN1894_c0_g1_i1:228-1040(-)